MIHMQPIDITKYKGLASMIPQPGEDYFKIVLTWFYHTKTGLGNDDSGDDDLMQLLENGHLLDHDMYTFIGTAPRPMEQMLFNDLDEQFKKNSMAYDFGYTIQRSPVHPATGEKVGPLQPDPALQAVFDYLRSRYYDMKLPKE